MSVQCAVVTLLVATAAAKKPRGELQLKILDVPDDCSDVAERGDIVYIIVSELSALPVIPI